MLTAEHLAQLASACRQELVRIGIHVPPGIRYCVNTRAKKRLGLCRRFADGSYEIQVSDVFASDKDDEAIKRVLIHELLHTLPGCMNHGKRWGYYARKVNASYPYEVARCSPVPPGMQPLPTKAPRYRIVCSGCGAEIFRQKASRLVREPFRYRCGRCGGRLHVTAFENVTEPACPRKKL